MSQANKHLKESDMAITMPDAQEDADLLALAEERIARFDPAMLITQAEVNLEFGFTDDIFKDGREQSSFQSREEL